MTLLASILLAVVLSPASDNAALQRAIDAELAAATPERPAVIEFSPGVYNLSGLMVRCNHLHPVARIEGNGATLKLLPARPKFSRLLTVEWDADVDSPVVLVRNLNFDLNKDLQNWDGTFSLEQHGGIFLTGQNPNTQRQGRLHFRVENCHAKNSCGSGFTFYHHTTGLVHDCSATDCFVSGFFANGGNLDVDFVRVRTSSPTFQGGGGRTSIQSEPQPGSRQSLSFIDCHPTVFDLGIPNAKSSVTLDRCSTALACNVYNNAFFRANRSTFRGGIFFTLVGDASLSECESICTDGTPYENQYLPLCCCWVEWHSKNQTLWLDRCRLRAADGLEDRPTFGLRVNGHLPTDNNRLVVSDCEASGLGTFLNMERHGSRVLVRDNAIDCRTAFRPAWSETRPYDLELVRNTFGPLLTLYWDTSYDFPQNKVLHLGTELTAAQNKLRGTKAINRLGLNQYRGGRLVVSDQAGAPVNQGGLPGDVYTDSTGARWRVTKPSYSAAQWEAVP